MSPFPSTCPSDPPVLQPLPLLAQAAPLFAPLLKGSSSRRLRSSRPGCVTRGRCSSRVSPVRGLTATYSRADPSLVFSGLLGRRCSTARRRHSSSLLCVSYHTPAVSHLLIVNTLWSPRRVVVPLRQPTAFRPGRLSRRSLVGPGDQSGPGGLSHPFCTPPVPSVSAEYALLPLRVSSQVCVDCAARVARLAMCPCTVPFRTVPPVRVFRSPGL